MAAQRIVSAGIPLQINTLVSAATNRHLEEAAKLVARLGASRWALFFLVPVGRARALHGISAAECELRLQWLAIHAPHGRSPPRRPRLRTTAGC